MTPGNSSNALWVAAGGALGAVSRHVIETQACHLSLSSVFFPWATFAINVSGAFLLGWILARAETAPGGGRWLRSFGGIGFCGAFTTFSSVNLEMVEMANQGHWPLAAAYLLASFLCGIVSAWLGARCGIEKREAQP